MKVNINEASISGGHRSALVFANQLDCAKKDAQKAVAVITEDGEMRFINEAFEKKIKAITKYAPLGFKRHIQNGALTDGYVYLTIDAPDFTTSDSISESLQESVQGNAPEEILFIEAEDFDKLVPNDIGFKINKEYKLWDKVDDFASIEIQPIYKDRDAILNEDKDRVIGSVDTVRSVFSIVDQKVADRINASAAQPIASIIGSKYTSNLVHSFSNKTA